MREAEGLPLELEAELFPRDEHVPPTSDPVTEFFDREDFARIENPVLDAAYKKRATDIRTAARGAAPGNDPPALEAEETFAKAFSQVAAEIRGLIRTGNWTNYVRNTVAANPEMAKAARQELVDALKET